MENLELIEHETTRKLATIREITSITPIEGADRIELATVGGWKVVVAKDAGHSVGDKVVYCEIDSFLPIRGEFEFLRKSSHKRLADGTEGFRLKTIRLRKQTSQGLILPISILEGDVDCGVTMSPSDCVNSLEVGTDVTDLLGITKYEPPIPPELYGQVKGRRPSFFPKTDEERVQNLTDEYESYKEYEFFVSEKLEGASFSAYFKDGEFGVCSRNLEKKRDENNTFWKVALDNDLENKLQELGRNLTIQGELVGEGIQGNIYKFKGQHLYVFNIYDINEGEYLNKVDFLSLCEKLDLKPVPTIYESTRLPDTVDEIIALADGKSALADTRREGLVWVSLNSPSRISFKTISNDYLAKQK